MNIIDKANKYIGHPREVDEGYEVSMRRTAYAQGYQDAIDKACEWLIRGGYFVNSNETIEDFRKAMED